MRTRTSLWIFAWVCLALLLVSSSAAAEDLVLEEQAELGVATTLGPQVALYGPPAGLKVQAQFWRELFEDYAFFAGLGLIVGGEADMDDGGADYDSTLSGELAVGVRWPIELSWLPIPTHVRGALNVDLTGGETLIGYSIGPSAAFGVSYPVGPDFELLGEVEAGLGFGQYKGSGVVLASTVDLLMGAQFRF